MKNEIFQKIGILLAVYLFLRFVLPLTLPFFLAWLSVFFLIFLQKKIHLKLFPLSICFLLVCILLGGSAAFCAIYLLYEPCQSLLPICQEYYEQCSGIFAWIPESLSGIFIEKMPFVFTCLFGIFLYFISVLLLAKDWEASQQLLNKLPFSKPIGNALGRITEAARNWIKAQFKIMFIVVVECCIGYYALNIPIFFFWAILTGLVDAFPVFGTGTIFLPWLLILILQKNYSFAIWIGILYFITWLTRELLEPKLLGNGLGLLPISFLMSVIIGLRLFGAFGLLFGPFGVLLVKELWTELENWAPLENSASPSSSDEEIPS